MGLSFLSVKWDNSDNLWGVHNHLILQSPTVKTGTPILQMGKLRFKEMECVIQGHASTKRQ